MQAALVRAAAHVAQRNLGYLPTRPRARQEPKRRLHAGRRERANMDSRPRAMNTPKRVYEQAIHNFPTASWFREISSEEFNDPAQDAMAVAVPAAVSVPTVVALPP